MLDVLLWLLLVVILGVIVWDQVTMSNRVAKRLQAARDRNKPFVLTKVPTETAGDDIPGG